MYRPPKVKQLDQNAIPCTPLADMMFLLLIFFIMTTTLARVTGFVSEMPASGKNQQPNPQQDKTPTVDLSADRIMVDTKDFTMDGLRTYLADLHLENKTGEGKVVVVSAAGTVNYQVYYEVLSMISQAGGVVAVVSEEGDK